MATEEMLKETRKSLERMQKFDAGLLSRVEDFGQQLNFSAVVEPARRLISIYTRIPITVVDDLTDQLCNQLKGTADADFNRLSQIMQFDGNQQNAAQQRKQLIAGVESAYEQTFNTLWNFIAYGVARVTDTSLLETEARATLQQIRDGSNALVGELAANKKSADEILSNVQKVAAEQGVSQQASYFKTQADEHVIEAECWAKRIGWAAGVTCAFAVLSIFLHKIPFLTPQNTYEASQLITSKILVFAVLGFLLGLASKNYMSHRHNAVVNRHRQTALLTYRSLADAAKDEGARDIVIAHAASCIFSPQDTGYAKTEIAGSKSILELLTKSAPKSD